jgi:prepilin-type N-terminal cleavage/methylation domain-containing protein
MMPCSYSNDNKEKIAIRGFTLVELLVVLGLFSGIITLAMGALFSSQSLNVRLQETQAAMDNVNLSMEDITRDIRYGSNFYATTTIVDPGVFTPSKNRSCILTPSPGSGGGGAGGCTVLYFKPHEGQNSLDRVAYYIDSNGTLFKKEIPYNSPYDATKVKTYQVTSNDVVIKSLVFFVQGAGESQDATNNDDGVLDYAQPLITVTVTGVAKPRKATSSPGKFTIESTVSPRGIDK